MASGLSTPHATTYVGTTGNELGEYVAVAFIVLDDDRVLAPGYRMSDSVYGRDAFDPDTRANRAALLRATIGEPPAVVETILEAGIPG